MSERSIILSVHKLRFVARRQERAVTAAINAAALKPDTNGAHRLRAKYDLPKWARGARVEKAGLFQWAVVVTSTRGH